MLYGVCGVLEMASAVKAAGYDYLEINVAAMLKPGESDDAFGPVLEGIRACGLPCLAANMFVPGELKITGPSADMPTLERYVKVAMARARLAGVRTIVFGSGGARRVPDGFSVSDATRQIAEFLRMAGPIAGDHGVTIAIEPLNRRECNIINTVAEAAAIARAVVDPSVKVLVDSYHWALENEPASHIVDAAELLAHVHVATAATRKAPGIEPYDFAPFFTALATACYDGGVSIEGGIPEPSTDLPRALSLMKAGG